MFFNAKTCDELHEEWTNHGQDKAPTTSGHEEMVWIQKLEAEQSEDAFDGKRTAVNKVSIEKLANVKKTTQTNNLSVQL